MTKRSYLFAQKKRSFQKRFILKETQWRIGADTWVSLGSLVVAIIAMTTGGLQTYVAWEERDNYRKSVILTQVTDLCNEIDEHFGDFSQIAHTEGPEERGKAFATYFEEVNRQLNRLDLLSVSLSDEFDFDLMKMAGEFSHARFEHAASGKPLPIMKILGAQIVLRRTCARLVLGLSVRE